MEYKSVIRLIAEILEVTQVPRAFGKGDLGAATKPWDELRGTLRLFGYPNADEHEAALHKHIQEVETPVMEERER